ncbi:MAG: Uracil phosphoribosyltransferase [Ignavibacteria bacterium]|nr:MAG: Uracil phosphoribosyltransferase [Ignavibacteria bacterium]KAF0159891.1 MAG: Uracil phosphoribosyltransferase [Ignavibacteria bacterium]
MKNFKLVDNPLVKRDVTILRNKETDTAAFRAALNRVSYAIAIELAKKFELADIQVATPLEVTNGFKLKKQIVLVPVLRAGLSMVEAFLKMIPDAKVGHIGLQRDEKTLQPIDYYYKTPSHLDQSVTIVVDPMLATGGSAVASFNSLKNKGANNCLLACLIAAPEGIKRMGEEHPEIEIYSAALDRQLSNFGYILPGLGDAGDRAFGTF